VERRFGRKKRSTGTYLGRCLLGKMSVRKEKGTSSQKRQVWTRKEGRMRFEGLTQRRRAKSLTFDKKERPERVQEKEATQGVRSEKSNRQGFKEQGNQPIAKAASNGRYKDVLHPGEVSTRPKGCLGGTSNIRGRKKRVLPHPISFKAVQGKIRLYSQHSIGKKGEQARTRSASAGKRDLIHYVVVKYQTSFKGTIARRGGGGANDTGGLVWQRSFRP